MTAAPTTPPTPLTTRQNKILDAIRTSRARRGCPPSPRELAALTRTPANVVLAELETLRDLGWLRPTTPDATDPTPEAPSATVEPPTEPARPLLTPRQREVLQHAAEGLTDAEIGANLGVTRNTIKTLLSRTYAALGATGTNGTNGRTHAVAIAIRAGIIQ